MAVILEDGIPIPDTLRKRAEKYPFDTMEVGQSFLLNGGVKNPKNLAARARTKHKPKRFNAAETPDGWRIWRVA
jgi:hypothetical protein